eukprot:TRINITY_DN11505_c0_g1_i1.p1 TRINITY_DN11505_c0_g1~~TRINITY_DN11505_c0_g1_i1.p1  ORF type:complete len:1471 (+),score=307.50 TRINITY_DN11505_c0_g1_i1:48-4460(+)
MDTRSLPTIPQPQPRALPALGSLNTHPASHVHSNSAPPPSLLRGRAPSRSPEPLRSRSTTSSHRDNPLLAPASHVPPFASKKAILDELPPRPVSLDPYQSSSHATLQKVNKMIQKLQRICATSPGDIELFFNNKLRESGIYMKVDQLPNATKRSFYMELLTCSRYLYTCLVNNSSAMTDAADQDLFIAGANTYGTRATAVSPMNPLRPLESALKKQYIPPPQNPTVSGFDPIVAPPTPSIMGRLTTAEVEKTSFQMPATEHVSKVSFTQDVLAQQETAKPPAQQPHPHQLRKESLSAKNLQGSRKRFSSFVADDESEASDARTELDANENAADARRRPSQARVKRVWSKLRIVKTFFSVQDTYYTNPEVAKEVFSLISSKRTAIRSKFIERYLALNQEEQLTWLRELTNQFIRVGTALSVLGDANSAPTTEESLKMLADMTADAVKADRISIFALDETVHKFHLVACTNRFNPDEYYDIGRGLAGHVMKTGSSLTIENFESHDSFDMQVDGEMAGKCIYCHPLRDQNDQVVGSISVVLKKLNTDDMKILYTLAAHAGLLVVNSILHERELRIRNRFDALVEVTNTISSELELKSLIQMLRLKSRELLQADRCTLYLVDQEKNELWTTLEEGHEIHFPISTGIAGYVATTGQTLNIPDAYADARFNQKVDQDTGYRTKNILCMPVQCSGGDIVGAIQMINKKRGPFVEDDEVLLEAFCANAAVAINNSQMYVRAVREQTKFKALVDISRAISSELELTTLIEMLRTKSRELVHADRCTLFLVDEEKNDLWTILQEGDEIHIPMGAGIAGYVAQSGVTLNIPDAYQEPRFNPEVDRSTGYVTKNILCMPVRNHDGKIVASIQMINKKGASSFNDEDEDLLSAFCSQAAVAIINSQLYRKTLDLNSYLQSILRGIKYYVIHIGPNGIVQSVNHSLYDVSGFDEDRLFTVTYQTWVGQRNQKLMTDIESVLGSDDVSIYATNYAFARASDIPSKSTLAISELEKCDTNRRKTTPLNYLIVPIKDSKGKKGGALLLLEDVSELESIKSTVSELQTQIGDMRMQASKIIEAPIQVVIRTIQTIAMGRFDPEEAQRQLLDCINIVSEADIFKPRLEEILDRNLDLNTKRWLLNEIAQGEELSLNVSIPMPSPELIARSMPTETPSILFEWELDATKFPPEYLVELIQHMFTYLGLLEPFHIPIDVLHRFLGSVRSNYNENPFHNFHHAFTVVHTVFLFICHTNAEDFLQPLDKLALLVAALGHDLDHPGLTNAFEVSSSSPLAILYNDVSVLENHHCFVTFRLLKNAETNILGQLTKNEYKELRKVIIHSILGTDMARHFEDLSKLNHRLDVKPFSRDVLEDRIFVSSVILHTADLSNPVRKFSISQMWADNLLHEFGNQVKKEKENNLPVSTFMIIPDISVQAKNEMGFIDFVVEPLWKATCKMLKSLDGQYGQLVQNRHEWETILQTTSALRAAN